MSINNVSSTNLVRVLSGNRVKRYDADAALDSVYLFTPIYVTWTDNPIEFFSGSNVALSGSTASGSNITVALSGSTTGSFFMSLTPDEGFLRYWTTIQWSGSTPSGSSLNVNLIDSRGNVIAPSISSPYSPQIGEQDTFSGTGQETVFSLTYVPSNPLTTVTVNGIAVAENRDFVVDYVTGQAFFVTPPSIGIGNISVTYNHPGLEMLTLQFTLSGSPGPSVDWILWQYAIADRLPFETGGTVI